MKNRKKHINAVPIIIVIVIALILGLFLIDSKVTYERKAHAKTVRDSINASRQYYLDSILNYKMDTTQSVARQDKALEMDL